MTGEAFLADVRRKASTLRAAADAWATTNPWSVLGRAPERIVLLGMGSSMYAASVAASRLRARGVVAAAELSSSDLLPSWGTEAVVVAVSAWGKSVETLDAVARLDRGTRTVAVTNVPGSPLTERCDITIDMLAEPEIGKVACRSYSHTLALLLALEAYLLDTQLTDLCETLEAAAEATDDLIRSEPDWCGAVVDFCTQPSGIHVIAPAARASSARQSALMLREVPCLPATSGETGDWAHVDEYLAKRPGYHLLVYTGSRWDAGVTPFVDPRGMAVFAVGGEIEGSRSCLRFRHDEQPDVALLAEVTVAELVAARVVQSGAGGS
jgi:fructoselysine-6-P-deglycase FrlB-like protein